MLLIRCLFLTCGLALALPPGWCCLLPARQVETTTELPQSACCRGHTAEHPTPPAEPTPPIKDCCCSPLVSILSPSVKVAQPDLAVSTLFLSSDVVQPGLLVRAELDVLSPSFSRSLQLLHCVWNC